jgi:hypothetical protein
LDPHKRQPPLGPLPSPPPSGGGGGGGGSHGNLPGGSRQGRHDACRGIMANQAACRARALENPDDARHRLNDIYDD